jgi:hypothetical protein
VAKWQIGARKVILQSAQSHIITQEEHMAIYQAEDIVIYKNKTYHIYIYPLVTWSSKFSHPS